MTDAAYAAAHRSSGRARGAIRLPAMRPATYGKGGAGARLDWMTAHSDVGRILVAATSTGLCFVEVGDALDALLAELRTEFPLADVARRPASTLRPSLDAAVAVATATAVPAAVPVDIRGTAFQWRVWRALTRIPRGTTRTYSEVAAAMGAPSSVRAVARACATNPIALVVPCHRVIGADGKLHGFRWGLDVKRALIEKERGAK